MSDDATKSLDQLEAEIDAARTRLAGTVDELHARTAPREIARREVASLKLRFYTATHTEDGDLRVERIAAVVATAVALLGLGAWRRHRG